MAEYCYVKPMGFFFFLFVYTLPRVLFALLRTFCHARGSASEINDIMLWKLSHANDILPCTGKRVNDIMPRTLPHANVIMPCAQLYPNMTTKWNAYVWGSTHVDDVEFLWLAKTKL